MTRSILGFLTLLAIIGASSAYAWYHYNHPKKHKPGYEMTMPEKGHQLRMDSKDPMGKFEKEMGERINRAEDRGVDLKSSDKELQKLRTNSQEKPTPSPTDFALNEEETLKEVLSSPTAETPPLSNTESQH